MPDHKPTNPPAAAADPSRAPQHESPRAALPDPSRAPLVELLTLAAPVAATMVSFTVAQFFDGLMVSRLGAAELAAQGNGGIIAFVPISIVMGLVTVVNTFVSQHYGAGSTHRAAAYAWNGLWICAACWLVFLLPGALGLRWLMEVGPSLALDGAGMMGLTFERGVTDPDVFEMQLRYARTLLLGSIFTVSARAIAHYFYGMHAPVTVLAATVTGNTVNVLFNYLLIFGKFGFPKMGIDGAALATVLGSMVEVSIPLAVFLGARMNARYATRAAWRPRIGPIRDVLRIGWPAGLMFGNEIICWAIFMTGILASISVADNAAGWIGMRYMHLSFMPAVGISIAVTALVGKCIGMGRPDLAVKRAWLGVRVNMVYMGTCAAVFVLFRRELVGAFIDASVPPEQAAEILRIGSLVMICAALFQLFDAMGITMAGALRGAGDTVWPGVVTVLLSWSIIIGGGWLMWRLFPELRSLGPWIAAAVYITAFAAAMTLRFVGGRWRSIRLLRPEDGAGGGAPVEAGASPVEAVSPTISPGEGHAAP